MMKNNKFCVCLCKTDFTVKLIRTTMNIYDNIKAGWREMKHKNIRYLLQNVFLCVYGVADFNFIHSVLILSSSENKVQTFTNWAVETKTLTGGRSSSEK